MLGRGGTMTEHGDETTHDGPACAAAGRPDADAATSTDAPQLDGTAIDALFDTLARYLRIRERATHTTFRLGDGEIETAAFKGLFHLARQPMRSRELAAILNADPSTVSRHVAQLVDLGLVRREADPDDGRATLLVVTDDGHARVATMREVRRAAMNTAMSDWTDEELWTLVRLLDRFVSAAESMMLSWAAARSAEAADPDQAPADSADSDQAPADQADPDQPSPDKPSREQQTNDQAPSAHADADDHMTVKGPR
ncbi:hypothetical protein GCM10009624_31630 [Gordonia sinesedis]